MPSFGYCIKYHSEVASKILGSDYYRLFPKPHIALYYWAKGTISFIIIMNYYYNYKLLFHCSLFGERLVLNSGELLAEDENQIV